MSGNGATSKYHPNLYEKYKEAFDDLKWFGEKINKNDKYEMNLFFATRMPSFVLMTVREQSTLLQKKKRLLFILNDSVIQNVYQNWDLFVKKINSKETKFYNNCRKKKTLLLLLDGYKRNIIMLLKNKIKELL